MSKLSFTVFAIGAAALSSMAGAETANAAVPGSAIAAPLASAAKSPVTKVQYGRYGYGGYGGYAATAATAVTGSAAAAVAGIRAASLAGGMEAGAGIGDGVRIWPGLWRWLYPMWAMAAAMATTGAASRFLRRRPRPAAAASQPFILFPSPASRPLPGSLPDRAAQVAWRRFRRRLTGGCRRPPHRSLLRPRKRDRTRKRLHRAQNLPKSAWATGKRAGAWAFLSLHCKM